MPLFAVFGKVCGLDLSQCILIVLIWLDLWFLLGRCNVQSKKPNQAHPKDIKCQMKMVCREFLASNVSHIELIIYIKKFTIVDILG